MYMDRVRAKKLKRGFTLVELIAAMAILAIIAAIVVPVTLHYIDDTQEVADETYTADVAKWADSCVRSLRNRSELVTSASLAAEINSLYRRDFPYDIGYFDEVDSAAGTPDLSEIRGVSEGASSYVGIYFSGSSVTVYLIKDGAEVESARVFRLLAV